MRIAVTGTHGSGKTTLIDDFIAVHPNYEKVSEPYWHLDQQGMPFADGPTTADLEEQLTASCKLILRYAAERDLIFDRCPLDFLAYLDIVSASEGFEWLPSSSQLTLVSKAMCSLHLLAFVPLISPDEIEVRIELPRLRKRVDQRFKAMLRDDDLGLLHDGPRVVEVTGSRAQRVEKLTVALGAE